MPKWLTVQRATNQYESANGYQDPPGITQVILGVSAYRHRVQSESARARGVGVAKVIEGGIA
jgi:hypothetical protein